MRAETQCILYSLWKKLFLARRRQLLIPENWIRDLLFFRCNTQERTWSIPVKILFSISFCSFSQYDLSCRNIRRMRKKDRRGAGKTMSVRAFPVLCPNRLIPPQQRVTVPKVGKSSSGPSLLLLQTLHDFTRPSLTCSSMYMSLSCWRAQNWTQHVFQQCRVEGKDHLPPPDGNASLLMQPTVLLAFAARTLCWLMISLLSRKPPSFFLHNFARF